MRTDTSAPDPQAQEPTVHTSIIKTHHPVSYTPRTDLEAIGAFVRMLDLTSVLSQLTLKPLRLYLFLAGRCNGQHFKRTGEMVSWPGERLMARKAGFRRSGSVYPALRKLAARGLIERVTIEIDGQVRKAFRVLTPEPSSGGDEAGFETVRSSRGMADSARSQRARAAEPGARSQRARAAEPGARSLQAPARAGVKRAQTGRTLEYETLKSETGKELRPTAAAALPLPAQEPPVDGRRAAAAAELEGLDINPGKIEELLALDTTTRTIVRAAAKVAKARKGEGGLIAWFVARPKQIPAKYVHQAERELQRPATIAAAAGGPPPGHVDREGERRIAQVAREALARARAEK